MKAYKIDMRCRVPGCKETSGGPRNRYMCKEHQKLSKKVQLSHLEEWNKKHKTRPNGNGVHLKVGQANPDKLAEIVRYARDNGLSVDIVIHAGGRARA